MQDELTEAILHLRKHHNFTIFEQKICSNYAPQLSWGNI